MRALLLRNPQSRRGGSDLSPALSLFESHGLQVETPDIEATPDSWCSALERAQKIDLVIIAGGDGSLNCAARGLLKLNKPFGLLPLGTANDFARTMGIATDLEEAVRIIIAGHEEEIDIGFVNGHPFFNVASIGVSAELALSLSHEVKQQFGRLGYLLTALRVLWRARPFSAIVKYSEGQARVRTLQVAVGNGRFYGGGMAVHHAARINDRRLHLYSLELEELWKLLLMAADFRTGHHVHWEEVRSESGSRFEVITRRPRPVNADGEIISTTPALFTIKPRALRVRAPANQPGEGVAPAPASV